MPVWQAFAGPRAEINNASLLNMCIELQLQPTRPA
jgi:hypothetical protein